jgi:hypothetical protein
MEPSFTIRPALPVDVEPIFSILSEVACHVPIDLSTPKHVGALKAQVDECCRGGLSFVAVDEDNVVVAFQLAKRARWFDDAYIHLTYAGVTAAASGKKVFRRLIDAEKGHGLPLVAVVKPGNKSEMVARLTRYGFRPFSNAPVNFAYRWDPERRVTA